MIRSRWSIFAAAGVAGVLAWAGSARAGDEVAGGAPAAPKAPAPAAAATPATPAETPATKTPSPIHSMMGWVAKQVAPSLECPCPGTADGEKAWRAWFDGGKDVPLASLRDAMVADGWTADRTVGFFKEKAAKAAAGGSCAEKCGEGKCAEKCADGKCCKGGEGQCCKGEGQAKAESGEAKPSCSGCPGKAGEAKTEPAPEAPAEAKKP
jgi:hypothetical protein